MPARCKNEVTKKDLTQWFFKITEYARELLDCLPQLDWPREDEEDPAELDRQVGRR